MKYCSRCGSEYRDEATVCADCGGTQLLSGEEPNRRERPTAQGEDQRKFVRVGSAEDPLTFEHLTGVIAAAHIPLLTRSHGSVMDPITSPSGPWWEILVLEEYAGKATEIIERERARLAAAADEAARAAEEEEAESERPPNRGE
jgi:hypothetical protein